MTLPWSPDHPSVLEHATAVDTLDDNAWTELAALAALLVGVLTTCPHQMTPTEIQTLQAHARQVVTRLERRSSPPPDPDRVSRATDVLTGLASRRTFDADLAAQALQARHRAQPLALVLIAIDQIAAYTATYGQATGDTVVQQIARILAATVRATDAVAHYDATTLVVLLPATTADQASGVAERCRAASAAVAWPLRPITVSCGVAAVVGEGGDPGDLLMAAAAALDLAKRRGRNQVVVAPASGRALPDDHPTPWVPHP